MTRIKAFLEIHTLLALKKGILHLTIPLSSYDQGAR